MDCLIGICVDVPWILEILISDGNSNEDNMLKTGIWWLCDLVNFGGGFIGYMFYKSYKTLFLK